MKISELKNTSLFLRIIFDFFIDNGIRSSIMEVSDYNLLLERILSSEITEYIYRSPLELDMQ